MRIDCPAFTRAGCLTATHAAALRRRTQPCSVIPSGIPETSRCLRDMPEGKGISESRKGFFTQYHLLTTTSRAAGGEGVPPYAEKDWEQEEEGRGIHLMVAQCASNSCNKTGESSRKDCV